MRSNLTRSRMTPIEHPMAGWAALILGASACGPGGPGDAAPADMACNGDPALCGRPVDAVSVAFAHNAMSSAEEGWIAPNQTHALPTQLEDGVRGFMLDTHTGLDGEPALCHGVCELGSTPLVDGLAVFTDFLRAHPREVVFFMIQNGISAADTAASFEAAGLLPYAYAHDPADPWPTLQELIDADTRLVVFHEGGGTGPDWYMDGYADHVWDNDYSAQTVADFGCERLRGDTSHPLYLVNHFLTAPIGTAALAEEANAEAVLWEHVARCEEESGQRVNWVAVDFYEIGAVLDVVDRLNGVGAAAD